LENGTSTRLQVFAAKQKNKSDSKWITITLYRKLQENYLRLLDDAKKKKFDVVIAKAVSRVGRNSINSMNTA